MVSLQGEKAPILQPLDWLGKSDGRIGAKLSREIAAAHSAELELQDEFADVSLVRRRRQGAVNGQFAAVDALDIRIEVVVILVMDAADVAEAGDTQRQQIGSGPEAIAVEELGLLLALHRGVGAGHRIAGLLE